MNNLEVHILSCKNDFEMLSNCIKSFKRFEYFSNVNFIVHDDGSIMDYQFNYFDDNNIKYIKRNEANERVREIIKDYPNCVEYRFGKVHHLFSLKLFDYFLLTETNNIMGVDSDILCINNPITMIDYINRDIPFYLRDFNQSYSFNKPKLYDVLPNVNAGIVHIPSSDHYHLDVIDNCLHDLVSHNGQTPWILWVEQSNLAHMFKMDGRYVELPSNLYGVPSEKKSYNDYEVLHFVSGVSNGVSIRRQYGNFII